MPSLKSFALLSLAAVGSLAKPMEKRWTGSGSTCMTFDEAQQVATNYGDLIANYNTPLAEKALAENFTDYSEGVNTLINSCPQGGAAMAHTVPLLMSSFNNRTAFEIGQGQQPHINFRQLDIWNACDTVIIRWETTNTANATSTFTAIRPVVGIIVLEVIRAPAGSTYPWIIDQVFSEFDSGAWLQNLEEAGICGTSQTPSQKVGYSGSAPATAPATTPAAPPASTATAAAYTTAAASSYVSAGSSLSYSSSPSSTWAASKRTPKPTPVSFVA